MATRIPATPTRWVRASASTIAQLVRAGNWAHDVGCFITSSLTIADRREHEHQLLAGYLDALGHRPVDAWRLYRRTPVFGLGSWLQTLAAGTFQPRDICLTTIERFAVAYRDARLEQANRYG